MSRAAATLDRAEASRLERLERTIERAVEAAGRIAGEALATIRDERLYRVTHSSFEAYVLDRWGFSRTTAYRMIGAASPRAHIDPPERESPGQRVPPRDTSPSAGPRPRELDTGSAGTAGHTQEDGGRLSATVLDSDGAEVLLGVDRGTERYPAVGQRVLVTWPA